MTRPPARCFTCQRNRVAWVKPRVDYCYGCMPGGPFRAPACRACASDTYFSDGLCEKCHPGGPVHLGSCRGCLAWGVYRAHNWHCWSCRWWTTHYPLGDCTYCRRNTRIGEQGACRLCLTQARMVQREAGRALHLGDANPLPLDTDAVRRALNSPDAATALAVALVAFHALTAKEIQELKLTDIVDGRLALDDRAIPLAGAVKARLTVWLDHRAARWPASINPHLFVGMRSAPRLGPVGKQFPWTKTDLRPQALREDRILQEIHATGGDIRRICDLFGLSVEGAQRYANTIAHP